MDYETLHEALNVESFRALGIPELRKCVKILEDEVYHRNRGGITYQQQKKIQELEEALGWEDSPERLEGFCLRITGRRDYRTLDARNASKLIVALRRMLEWVNRRKLTTEDAESAEKLEVKSKK